MLWESLMWKHWLNGKVKIVEVVSHNVFLQSKGMMALSLVGWNDIILILRKVIRSFFSLLWGSPSGPFLGRVNVIELWTYYGTLLGEPNVWITLWERRLTPSEYGKGKSL